VLQFSAEQADSGAIQLDLDLGRNAVALIEAMPADDESADYAGLDESRVPGHTP